MVKGGDKDLIVVREQKSKRLRQSERGESHKRKYEKDKNRRVLHNTHCKPALVLNILMDLSMSCVQLGPEVFRQCLTVSFYHFIILLLSSSSYRQPKMTERIFWKS